MSVELPELPELQLELGRRAARAARDSRAGGRLAGGAGRQRNAPPAGAGRAEDPAERSGFDKVQVDRLVRAHALRLRFAAIRRPAIIPRTEYLVASLALVAGAIVHPHDAHGSTGFRSCASWSMISVVRSYSDR